MKKNNLHLDLNTKTVNGYYSQLYLEQKINGKENQSLVVDSSDIALLDNHKSSKYPLTESQKEAYKLIVLIDVLNFVSDFKKLISDSKRSLKKGGRLVITCASMALPEGNLSRAWGFTSRSIEYLLEQKFGKNWTVENYGNVLTGRYFITNKNINNLTKDQLLKKDEHFVVVTGAEAIKK